MRFSIKKLVFLGSGWRGAAVYEVHVTEAPEFTPQTPREKFSMVARSSSAEKVETARRTPEASLEDNRQALPPSKRPCLKTN